MDRVLPLAAVQAAQAAPGQPVSAFAEDAQRVARTFPQARLIVYPELHLHGGADTAETYRAQAETLRGPRVRDLAQLAGDLGVWLLPGSVCETGPDGQLYNTAVVLSPHGRLAAFYRKVTPWRPYEPFDPGDRFVVFDLPGAGRAGLNICYDAWFPEITRHLAWMGAEVVFNLVRTTTCDRTQEIVLARANAIMNQVFVVSVNAAGPAGTGQSLIVDPEGLVRVQSATEATVLSDVLDLGHVARVRRYGTAGLTRPWAQFRPGDAPLALPLYGGAVVPERWAAAPDPAPSGPGDPAPPSTR
ncbi:carbon-nitrogen hydrolase family protein (plasmid) [Deinococcus taeanensis]|uniref:carbon-nitrogen hydrolase family protein n=1 Tax=Deinococcus taeanensis TaxID=2737050 RepID=UPI001CDBBE00|nr:carbon-nitrogen hydrolase family protein [Deinococcus taeanensis]UBV44358.1 carbon-nitrogen hydrolase family protein [Deinococcus taeanensis]